MLNGVRFCVPRIGLTTLWRRKTIRKMVSAGAAPRIGLTTLGEKNKSEDGLLVVFAIWKFTVC